MEEKVKITNLKKIGLDDSILVNGKVKPQAQRFEINLGQDASNLLIHFNPRFETNVVVYNSRRSGEWLREARDSHFPFKRGENTHIHFTITESGVIMTYPDGHKFDYKPQINLDNVKYISVAGDIEVQSVNIQ